MKKMLLKKIVAVVSACVVGAAVFAEGNNSGVQILNSVFKGQSIYSMPFSSVISAGVMLDVAAAAEKDPVYDVNYDHKKPSQVVAFKEVWAYLLDGNFGDYRPEMDITDLCIFSADINSYGELNVIPDVRKVKGYEGRKHLVVTSQSRSLTHFVLDPSFGLRKKIIDKLVEATTKLGYDGIQVDFELIPQRDANNFVTFLADIQKAIGPEKWMSVAVPARTKTLKEDIFNYKKLEPYVDRVFIMCYDEHWSGGKPGPVASTDWCRNVATYAYSQLPQKKIVMGIPFYGRTWEDRSLAKAWFFDGIMRNLNENDVAGDVKRDKDVPYFSYETTVKITGYFDDSYSVVSKCLLYKDKKIDRIGFWCLGQEDPDVWNWVKSTRVKEAPAQE